MKAQFKIEITKRVSYLRENTIDEVYACATLGDLVRELEAQGGIRLRKGDEEKGMDQCGGYRVVWGRVAEGETLFGCRCGCLRSVKRDGGFRPGHDAKLVGKLLYLVRERSIKQADALAELADRPKLAAKLLRLLGE